jgi:hypothetical protein
MLAPCIPGTVPVVRANSGNSGKSGKVSPKIHRTEFPGISGNFFREFPGIPEIPGNFSGNLEVFPKTRTAEQCTRPENEMKIEENPGFFRKKSPGNPRKIPREIPGKSPEKTGVFFLFFSGARKDTACFWKILGENSAGKFPDFREIFPREIPRIPENPGNFRKKRVKNGRFWKN